MTLRTFPTDLHSRPYQTHEHQHRTHTAHDVDWNTIWCECKEDIYSLIREFVKENELE